MVDGVKAMDGGTPEDTPREDPPEEFRPPLDAEGRVRLFVELYQHPNIGGEIVSDDRFRSDEWPRRMYALWRDDLVEVLKDLDIYEDELSKAYQQTVQAAKRIKELEDLVASLRLNGARHWFTYGYQKCTNVPLSHWTDFCKVCDKEKDHPAHFAADAEYLDSRAVEKAVSRVHERLCKLLREGLGLGAVPAVDMAQELLQGLPGIKEAGT